MRRILLSLFFTCVYAMAYTQVNYVKNPSFEEYSKCPTDADQITYAKFWSNAIDTEFHVSSTWQSEYYNSCAIGNRKVVIPDNIGFYQNARTGSGIVGASFYFDKTPPSSVFPDYREYVQGHLLKALQNGKNYCVCFYVNLMETSGYSQDKIGAYLDDGSINKMPIPIATEITTLIPQIYSLSKIKDTLNWIKIEGAFTASGNETYITIGNFFKNADVNVDPFWGSQYSYYLIDDVSVIPMDLDVQAGEDTWVGLGATRKIGRIKDSATIQGLDCKWYHKGVLIDSGGIITVHANAVKGAIDTYVVVQTICGLVKTDTVLVSTVGAGMSTFATTENTFSISPNPSNGKLVIAGTACPALAGKQSQQMFIKVYDLLGRVVYEQSLILNKAQTPLELNLAKGTYMLELRTEDAVQIARILIE